MQTKPCKLQWAQERSIDNLSTSDTSMAKFLSLFFLFSLIAYVFFNSVTAEHSNPHKPTGIHRELTKYGFPMGLLPYSVRSYSIDQTSGDFSIYLGGPCKITLPPDNYPATYSAKVTGKIVQGRISELNGIRVWAYFKWWSITGIRSSGEDLVLEIGMLTAKYPSKDFEESPECEGKHSAS